MTMKSRDCLPLDDATLWTAGSDGGSEVIAIVPLFKDKETMLRIVLSCISSTCQHSHLPRLRVTIRKTPTAKCNTGIFPKVCRSLRSVQHCHVVTPKTTSIASACGPRVEKKVPVDAL